MILIWKVMMLVIVKSSVSVDLGHNRPYQMMVDWDRVDIECIILCNCKYVH